MSEKPILFNAEMVRAILDGRKTQTRRVIKPQPKVIDHIDEGDHVEWSCKKWPNLQVDFLSDLVNYGPYTVGDLLWVREAWRQGRPMLNGPDISGDVAYRADYANSPLYNDKIWKPSIHMPRWAARIWLEITGVQVEQVQDISEEDAKAEGIKGHSVNVGTHFNLREIYPAFPEKGGGFGTAREAFEALWDSINAKRGYPWEMNPFVWVIEFKRKGKE